MPLSPRRQRFAEEYVIDFNGKQAAIRAGYSPATAEQQASRMLRDSQVRAEVEKLQRRLVLHAASNGITAERVLNELARIGFSDIRQVVKWRSNVVAMRENPDTGEESPQVVNEVELIDSDKLTDVAAASIAEISQTQQGGLKVKLYDKRAALVDLGKHLGLFGQMVAPGKKQAANEAARDAGQGSDWAGDLEFDGGRPH
jgi:phage terminase small subunit